MKVIRNLATRSRGITVLVVATAVMVLALVWSPQRAEGQLSGYAEVTRLELGYVVERQALQARISLATGPSLIYEPASERDSDTLLKMAQIFGQRGTRMSVAVKDDRIKSIQVSIP